jgi:hypothetical protein
MDPIPRFVWSAMSKSLYIGLILYAVGVKTTKSSASWMKRRRHP